jgi:hypothetical protein
MNRVHGQQNLYGPPGSFSAHWPPATDNTWLLAEQPELQNE